MLQVPVSLYPIVSHDIQIMESSNKYFLMRDCMPD